MTSGWRPRFQWKVAYALATAALVLRVTSLLLRRYDDVGDTAGHVFQAYQVVISINALTHSLELLPFITRLHPRFGVLVIVVEKMMLDLKLFVEYLAVVFGAFTLAFFGLGRAGMHSYDEGISSYDGVLTITTWSMYGWLEPRRMDSVTSSILLFICMLLSGLKLQRAGMSRFVC